MKFIPSLELSKMLFEEEISQIMEQEFPELKYAAVTITASKSLAMRPAFLS